MRDKEIGSAKAHKFLKLALFSWDITKVFSLFPFRKVDLKNKIWVVFFFYGEGKKKSKIIEMLTGRDVWGVCGPASLEGCCQNWVRVLPSPVRSGVWSHTVLWLSSYFCSKACSYHE